MSEIGGISVHLMIFAFRFQVLRFSIASYNISYLTKKGILVMAWKNKVNKEIRLSKMSSCAG